MSTLPKHLIILSYSAIFCCCSVDGLYNDFAVLLTVVRKQRRHHRARPTSPYSTDSNFSEVVRKPYPKSQRKKQLMDQGTYSTMLITDCNIYKNS